MGKSKYCTKEKILLLKVYEGDQMKEACNTLIKKKA